MNRKLLFLLSVFSPVFASLALAQPTAKTSAFKFQIEGFESRPVTPEDVAAGYDTQLVVVLGHQGKAPAWWLKHNGTSSAQWGEAQLLYRFNGQTRPISTEPSFRYEIRSWTPAWNLKTQRYEARYLFRLSSLFPSKESVVLQGKISLYNFSASTVEFDSPQNQSVAFSYTVRRRGQVIAPPKVSRDPKFTVQRITIERLATPREQRLQNRKYDTVVRIFIRDQDASSPGAQSGGYPSLVDKKGKRLPTNKYKWNALSDTKNLGESQMMIYYQFLLSAIPKTHPDIIIDTDFSLHGNWPLGLHIPLRRNGNNLSGELAATQYSAAPIKGR